MQNTYSFALALFRGVWKLSNDHNSIIVDVPLNSSNSVQNCLYSIRPSNRLVQMDERVALMWSKRKSKHNKVFYGKITNLVKNYSKESHY